MNQNVKIGMVKNTFALLISVTIIRANVDGKPHFMALG